MFGALVWEEAKPIFSTYVQPHPVDTHPPLGLRLKSLGVELEDKDATIAQPADSSAISVLSSAPEIEERLTVLEIRWLEAIGAVVLPKGDGQ
jgi:Zn-dependent protease with chaperone function